MVKVKIISLGVALVSLFFVAHAALGQTDEERQKSAARAYVSCVSLAKNNPDRAISVAQNWRDSGGGTPASHCLALALAANGDYTESAYELSRAAEILRNFGRTADASTSETRLAIADLLAQSGNAWLLANEALRAYDIFSQALSEISSTSLTAGEIYVDRARASYELMDFEGTMSDLERAQNIYSNRTDIMVYKASALRAMERFDEAQIAIANALALSPDDEAALLERGNVRFSLGIFDGAREDWAQILMLYPNSVAAEMARKNIEALDGIVSDSDG